jgi:hypothetical protein
MIAFSISLRLEAPVERTIGFPFEATLRKNGVFVRSAEAILKKGTSGSRNSIDASSKGVDKKSIPTFLQCSASCINSFAPKLSYFLNNSC